MRLLIVEDEKLAREGLLKIIDWAKFGIDRIFVAEDGKQGLQMVKMYRPDILLTDIHLPGMDGIALAEKVCKLTPQCRIIFLSAYSDKDYLKAAIKLKALSYLEKPVVVEELMQVMAETVKECNEIASETLTKRLNFRQKVNRIALKMTMPSMEETVIGELNELMGKTCVNNNMAAVTFLIKARTDMLQEPDTIWSDVEDYIDQLMKEMNNMATYVQKREDCLALHVFFTQEPSATSLYYICKQLKQKISSFCNCYVVCGKTVSHIVRTYESYNSAVVLLQKTFYYPIGQILIYDKNECEFDKPFVSSDYQDITADILRSLETMDSENVLRRLGELYEKLQRKKVMFVERVKEIYFDLLFEIFRNAQVNMIHIGMDESENSTWIDKIRSYNLDELDDYIKQATVLLFQSAENFRDEKSLIKMIKEYINRNFCDYKLSVKTISEYVKKSNSYICTVFKNETGTTINQYLTDVRMEKAKQFLKDPKYNVAEISIKVGYNDNSYFGRAFRKNIGMTPMEYREGWNR